MKLFNTLGRAKQDLVALDEGEIRMYSCGPTVYDYAHIGNLRAFLTADLLKRYLVYRGFRVTHVMNITDVDDKTIRRAHEQGKPLSEFTRFYEDLFLEDLDTLGVKRPDILPRATEHVDEMIAMIQKLLDGEYAYEREGSVYFSIKGFDRYGELAQLERQQLKTNAQGRLDDEYDKDDARDFVLWKGYQQDDGAVAWDSPFGRGRPGWHIECSAMAIKYLGESFDIHTGGIDLIFPHHTNEIAQSECSHTHPFVKHWFHNAHLIVDGEKMSKSAGNFYTLRDLLQQGHDPHAIRYELLATHYRQQLDFRVSKLADVKETLARFSELFVRLDNAQGEADQPEVDRRVALLREEFIAALDDDLNIAKGLSALFTFVRDINKHFPLSKGDALIVKDALLGIDEVLGVMGYEPQEVPPEVLQLAEDRKQARDRKDFDEADRLRKEIKKAGFIVDDQDDGGFIVKKA